MRLLLQVQDTFLITGRGLILAPDLPFPPRFNHFSSIVTVETPGGDKFEAKANFYLTHFRLGGYKLHITLPEVTTDSVPIGSNVLAPESVHSQLVVSDA